MGGLLEVVIFRFNFVLVHIILRNLFICTNFALNPLIVCIIFFTSLFLARPYEHFETHGAKHPILSYTFCFGNFYFFPRILSSPYALMYFAH